MPLLESKRSPWAGLKDPEHGKQEWISNPELSRLLLYYGTIFLLRLDFIRRAGAESDINLSAVWLTAFLRSIESGTRSADFLDKFGSLDAPLDYSSLPPINALSIAAATGLPRETVRRKVHQLVDKGLMVKRGPGQYALDPNPQNTVVISEGSRRTIGECLRFINACVATGAVHRAGAVSEGGSVKEPGRQVWIANPKLTRMFLYHAVTLMMRTDNFRRVPNDGDLDRAGIMMQVWLRAVDSGTRDPEFIEQYANLDIPLSVSGLPLTNAASIAAATGLPRGTVRRKLRPLIEEGFADLHENGRIALGSNRQHDAVLFEAFRLGVQECLRLINICITTGVVCPK